MKKLAQVSVDEAVSILENCLSENDPKVIRAQLSTLKNRMQHPDYINTIGRIEQAFNIPDGQALGVAVDPDSNKPYPNSKGLLRDFIEQLKGHKTVNSMTFTLKQAQKQESKKKKRGNPFRVLMGKVGKLLDHGLKDRDISRHLAKEGVWDANTISKAVEVVKEYNKKKRKKTHKEAQTLLDTAKENERMQIDYKKRSHAELITSLCWLNSLDKMASKDNPNGKQVEDRDGVKTMIRKIKSELTRRGMKEEDLKNYLK